MSAFRAVREKPRTKRHHVGVGAGHRWFGLGPGLHAGHEVAVHAELRGRHGRVIDDAHLAGIAGTKTRPICVLAEPDAIASEAPSALLRPLAEYEAAIGGGF